MERSSKPFDIPSGRVAQRLQALQESTSNPGTRRASKATTSSRAATFVAAPQERQSKTPSEISHEKQSETSTINSRQHVDPVELSTARPSPQNDRLPANSYRQKQEAGARGRSLQCNLGRELQDSEDFDDVMDDVRSKLHSVRKIVRRGRSGSSQARDEMLDDLGTMLDTAIATTMTPLNTPKIVGPSPFMQVRAGSVSPAKPSRPHTPLARAHSARHVNPLHIRLSSPPPLQTNTTVHSARVEATSAVQSPTSSKKSSLAGSELFVRPRQTSEPAASFPRPHGFPLTSPVRERTLLWESMSRAAIEEENPIRCPHFVTRSHPVSPGIHDSIRAPTVGQATPPIPLALPQLLDVEKQATKDTSTATDDTEEKNEMGIEFPDPPTYTKPLSSQWPERLHLVSSSTTTVQQSPSIAKATDHDEHKPRQNSAVVKGKIKDLLTSAERNPSSGKAESSQTFRTEVRPVQVREMRASVSDAESIDLQYLPHLQAHPDELKQLYTTDGGQSSNQPVGNATNADHAGTSSSKMLSRKSTFDRKFGLPKEKRAFSPVKTGSSTPVRGGTRDDCSPGGRPYSIDHRFALSPSRSDSRGSRGSLTFNIKARVSPGRKSGKKDDTELFVTASIESDGSDEAA